jgi:hypothetical protein
MSQLLQRHSLFPPQYRISSILRRDLSLVNTFSGEKMYITTATNTARTLFMALN